MTNQLDAFEVHKNENNYESKRHLEENREGFSEQCSRVYALLKDGARLSVMDAVIEYQISSLPRRIKDINDSKYFRDNDLSIKSEWIHKDGKRKYKVYYL